MPEIGPAWEENCRRSRALPGHLWRPLSEAARRDSTLGGRSFSSDIERRSRLSAGAWPADSTARTKSCVALQLLTTRLLARNNFRIALDSTGIELILWPYRFSSVSSQFGDGRHEGFVVQPLLSQRSSLLCARAKAVASMRQEGRKSLRPKQAIAKVIGSASTLNRRWPKKARRHDSREKALDRVEAEDVSTNRLWLDLREEEPRRLQRFQTLALPLPLSGWLPGLDTGCCRLPGSRRPVSVTRNSWSAES